MNLNLGEYIGGIVLWGAYSPSAFPQGPRMHSTRLKASSALPPIANPAISLMIFGLQHIFGMSGGMLLRMLEIKSLDRSQGCFPQISKCRLWLLAFHPSHCMGGAGGHTKILYPFSVAQHLNNVGYNPIVFQYY